MMKKILMPLLVLAATGLIAGCSSSTQIHYYTLNSSHQSATMTKEAPKQQLILAPLAIANQIDSVSLVYQLEGQELHYTEQHRWAGTLDQQLEQLTLNTLSAQLPNWVVRDSGQEGQRLAIILQHFGGRYDGHAVIAGRWRLSDADGKVLVDQTFNQERPLAADGYNALVTELSLGWEQVMQQIAQRLNSTP